MQGQVRLLYLEKKWAMISKLHEQDIKFEEILRGLIPKQT